MTDNDSDTPIETVGQWYERQLRKQSAEIERLRQELADAMHDIDRMTDTTTELATDNERLRAALQGMVALAKGQKLDGYIDVVYAERVLAGSPRRKREVSSHEPV